MSLEIDIPKEKYESNLVFFMKLERDDVLLRFLKKNARPNSNEMLALSKMGAAYVHIAKSEHIQASHLLQSLIDEEHQSDKGKIVSLTRHTVTREKCGISYESFVVYFFLGLTYFYQKEHGLAIECCKKALNQNPFVEGLVLWIFIHDALENIDEITKATLEIIKLPPVDDALQKITELNLGLLGMRCYMEDSCQQAAGMLELYIGITDEDDRIPGMEGFLAYCKGDYVEAEKFMTKRIKQFSGNSNLIKGLLGDVIKANFYLCRGQSRIMQGNIKGARHDFGKAEAMNPRIQELSLSKLMGTLEINFIAAYQDALKRAKSMLPHDHIEIHKLLKEEGLV